MKRILIITLFVLAASSLAPGEAQDRKPLSSNGTGSSVAVESMLIEMEHEMTEAFVRHDVSVFDRILADDLVDTGVSGEMTTKAQDLAGIKSSSGLSDLFFRVDDLKARAHGDTGIVTGIAIIRFKIERKEVNDQWRFTDTFMRRQGRWQLVATQQTRIPAWRARSLAASELKPLTAQDCSQESSVRSLADDVQAYIKFTNETSLEVTVYWINYAGARDRERPLKPGQSIEVNTYVTHPFVVTGTQDRCLGLYLPKQEPSIVVIRER